jgi:hypothetical protein
MDKKLLKNSEGSALILMLCLFVALVGYTLYFIYSARLEQDIKMRMQNEINVISTTAKIRSILSSPANCNSTFINSPPLTASGQLSGIRTCTGGNCFVGPGGSGSPIQDINVTTSSWDKSVTGMPTNVRITKIEYITTRPQNNVPPNDAPAIVELTMTFEKRVRNTISQVITKLEQHVVFNSSNQIYGCPKGPNSIDAAGDNSCHYPWSPFTAKLAHGNSVTAYLFSHHVNCAAYSQSRTCSNTVLSGDFIYQTCAQDGVWSNWTDGTCNIACGGGTTGTQIRTRSCNSPAPGPGGHYCDGNPQEEVSCTGPASAPCPT